MEPAGNVGVPVKRRGRGGCLGREVTHKVGDGAFSDGDGVGRARPSLAPWRRPSRLRLCDASPVVPAVTMPVARVGFGSVPGQVATHRHRVDLAQGLTSISLMADVLALIADVLVATLVVSVASAAVARVVSAADVPTGSLAACAAAAAPAASKSVDACVAALPSPRLVRAVGVFASVVMDSCRRGRRPLARWVRACRRGVAPVAPCQSHRARPRRP